MNLKEIFNKYKITNVTDDTRDVVQGSLFVAVKGENFDGEKAADEMLAKGAVAVITQNDSNAPVSEKHIVVENARLALAQAASLFYGNPTARLKLIAVTGTNGKSTVASLIKIILEKLGHKTGFIGTTGYDVCNPNGTVYEAKLSTPRQAQLYSLFAEMVANNAEFCVMEASSQALDQYRIAGEIFEVGVFTNLTQDHLDWHKTMDNYYQSKKMLFGMCKSAVVCIDDKYGVKLAAEIDIPVTTFSINNHADFYAINVKTSSSGVSYRLTDLNAGKSMPFNFRMPGLFNISNSMAAVATCTTLGFDTEACIAVLEDCHGVRGRCEVIYDGDFTVICDYAHTEDALVKILTSTRQFAKRRLLCLFGAAGERDKDKRPSMGATAAKYSDYLIITSDNPRFEDPARIISEVESGIKNGKHAPPYKTFTDRKEAIKFALSEAEKDDIILLCGKGHETYQVIGDDYQPFDEREIVRQLRG